MKENNLGLLLNMNSKIEIIKKLTIELIFEHGTINKELKKNEIYTISFLKNGTLETIKGKIVEITSLAGSRLGVITVDYSNQYESKTINIDIGHIRDVKDDSDMEEIPEPDKEEKPDETPSSDDGDLIIYT